MISLLFFTPASLADRYIRPGPGRYLAIRGEDRGHQRADKWPPTGSIHWPLSQVHATDLPDLHTFARGLERDRDALNAALTVAYSNDPTRGQQKDQGDRAPDARTSRLRPPPPPHPLG